MQSAKRARPSTLAHILLNSWYTWTFHEPIFDIVMLNDAKYSDNPEQSHDVL